MAMNIRKYNERDFENFRNICIATAPKSSEMTEREQKVLTLMYCEYYVECESDVCFALTDDNDCAVGYVLCSRNALLYKKLFKKYIREIMRISPVAAWTAYWGARIYLPYYKEYPAHIHIDILPEYQSLGYGTRLIGALKKELTSRRVKGMMLCVDKDNEKAVGFYKKNGFEVLKSVGGGLFMGCKL